MGPWKPKAPNRPKYGSQFWGSFLEQIDKRHPEINAKIDIETGSKNVTIETKRDPKMMPKWNQKS